MTENLEINLLSFNSCLHFHGNKIKIIKNNSVLDTSFSSFAFLEEENNKKVHKKEPYIRNPRQPLTKIHNQFQIRELLRSRHRQRTEKAKLHTFFFTISQNYKHKFSN